MREYSHWSDNKLVENTEIISHGEMVQKFVAVSDAGSGDFTVEIHGFVTVDGNFIIISEQFRRKTIKE